MTRARVLALALLGGAAVVLAIVLGLVIGSGGASDAERAHAAAVAVLTEDGTRTESQIEASADAAVQSAETRCAEGDTPPASGDAVFDEAVAAAMGKLCP